MPYKIFSRMCTCQIYMRRSFDEQNWTEYARHERERDELMEQFRWPWSATTEQTQEWNDLCRRLDP